MTLTSISYICFHAQNIATKPTGGGFQCFTVYSESTNYFERMRCRARAIQRLQLLFSNPRMCSFKAARHRISLVSLQSGPYLTM